MLSGPTPQVARPVQLPDPVNRNHPLNRGRVAWFLALPGLAGGIRWPNLMGGPSATATILPSASGGGWRGTTRPGGFGHYLFDGSTSQVDLDALGAWPSGAAARTIAVWALKPSASLSVLIDCGTFSGTKDRFLMYDTGGGKFTLDYHGGGPTSSRTIADGAWHRMVATYNGANIAIYVDGAPDGTGLDSLVTAATPPRIGASGGGGASWNGPIDDVTCWSRSLSAAEVAADYDLSRRGYPGVLNRY